MYFTVYVWQGMKIHTFKESPQVTKIRHEAIFCHMIAIDVALLISQGVKSSKNQYRNSRDVS